MGKKGRGWRMTDHLIDLEIWPRADQFQFFRRFERPHYATTCRIDVNRLMAQRKSTGVSPYRACLYAIGAGIHRCDALRIRFRETAVTRYEQITLSMTVPRPNGSFNYAYVPWTAEFSMFDTQAASLIAQAARQGSLNPNLGDRNDVAYMSCMPWLDYTSLNNAMPGPQDCIPRVSWGKIVQGTDGQWDMAMTLEVHHAVVDGRDVGQFFELVQQAINTLS